MGSRGLRITAVPHVIIRNGPKNMHLFYCPLIKFRGFFTWTVCLSICLCVVSLLCVFTRQEQYYNVVVGLKAKYILTDEYL